MKKELLFFLFLIFSLAFTTSCSAGKHDKNPEDGKTLNVQEFNSISLRGGFTVSLSQGDKSGISVEAPNALMNELRVSVDDGELKIVDTRFERGEHHDDWENMARRIHLNITIKSLKDLRISGYVSLKTKEPLMTDNLNIDIEGGGRLRMDLVTEKLGINIEGGVSMELGGQVRYLTSHIEGAGKISAYDMKVNRADISINGAGYASVNVSDHLKVDMDGVGWVRYKGDPMVEKNVDGVGFVSKE
ncbi:head GIN domain-containing protein [Prolixibacter sp. NT017]|uniref:head GIN domain-containing protein n=1 Tax=Prolixibacter sp. NT017 TaxID=2652390 RepID=UPI001284EF7F|nr:head GIN domain-containing protein [Prolixibacter sp. NT017]GET26184.1 hypothetical protein NT017_25130 [Prolixibacter sp. NT017]